MMEKTREAKSFITLRRVLTTAAVLLLFALVLVAPTAADTTIEVSSQTELESVISNINENEPTTINLAVGTYKLSHLEKTIKKKTITFYNDSKKAKIDLTDLNARNGVAEGATLTFDGVEIVLPPTGWLAVQDYPGFGNKPNKLTYKNCIISGYQYLYAPSVEFDNCIFKGNDGKDIYYVNTYGATDVKFTGCTFHTSGKAILVYYDSGTLEATITLDDCVFYSDGEVANDKAAVEVGSDYKQETYTLTLTDCVAFGFVENPKSNPPTGTNLWGNKNSLTTITVDRVINDYTVTWIVKGEDDKTVTVQYGQKPDYGDAPTRDPTAQYTYTFKEWENENGETFENGNLPIVRKDVTYTAVFTETPRTYTVRWTNETDFELEKDENVAYGTMPTYNGAEPTKSEDEKFTYSFNGWKPELSAVEGDITYEATYTETKKDYLLTWDFNGGDTTDTTYTQAGHVVWGEPIEYPDDTSMVRSGYTFSGWNETHENMPTADTTIKARWTEVTPSPDPSPAPSPSEYKGSSIWLTETPTPTPTETQPTETPTVTPTQPTDDDNDDGIPLAALIGGGVIVLIIAGLSAWFVVRRR